MHVALIWAMTRNRVIGKEGGLPWRLPDEMRHFMNTTMGKPVIMGRKTFQSMKAPLPGRLNIVLTRDETWQPSSSGVVVCHEIEQALVVARQNAEDESVDEVMIIGGADVYALGLPHATRLYMTDIHAEIEGDTLFPDFDVDEWREVSRVEHTQDDRHDAAFTIRTLERRSTV